METMERGVSPHGGRARWRWAFFILNAAGIGAVIMLQCYLLTARQELLLLDTTPAALAGSDPARCEPGEIGVIEWAWAGALDPEQVTPDAVRVSPALPGKTVLRDGRFLRFEPEKPLALATRYAFTFAPTLRGLGGERLPEREFIVQTPGLAVRDISHKGLLTQEGFSLAIRWNAPVHPDALREHLFLTEPNGSPVAWEPVGGLPDARTVIQMHKPASMTINLRIAKGLTCVEGPIGLAEDYKTMIIIARASALPPPLGSGGTPPVMIRAGVVFHGMKAEWNRWDDSGQIDIRTNLPLDASRAKDFIAIEPKVPFAAVAYGAGLRLTGEFGGGKRYQVTLRKGFPAGDAHELNDTVTRSVWFPDVPPSMRFTFGGGYLSPGGLLTIPVRTVNMAKAELTVSRLYPSNVVEHVLNRDDMLPPSTATLLARKGVTFPQERNTPQETLLRLREFVPGDPKGVFGLTLTNDERWYWRENAVVVVTDIGLSVRLSERQAVVWVTSLEQGTPLAGATVRLYSDRRQEIASGLTDANGLAELAVPRLPEGEQPALILATLGEDMSFLGFGDSARLRGEGTGAGKAYPGGEHEAFLTPERGVYRPGDEARLSGLVRGPDRSTPTVMPLDLVVHRPDGRELTRLRTMTDAQGRVLASIPLPGGAPSGPYEAQIRMPGMPTPLGSARFRVADYIPNTLAMELTAPEELLSLTKPLTLAARVRHLFGDPAAGLKAACSAHFVTVPHTPKGWESYHFGDKRAVHETRDLQLPEQTLDGNGAASFVITPPNMEAGNTVELTTEVTVREPGGRALVEHVRRRLDPWPFRVGVRQPDAPLTPLEPAAFELVAIDGSAAPAANASAWAASWHAVSYSNVLRARDGRLNYEWTRHETREGGCEGTFDNGRATFVFTPEHPGPYRLVITALHGGAVTLDVHVAGTGGTWLAHDPDRLELRLDRPSHRIGEEAFCTVQSPFAGTALICIEGERVSERRVVPVEAGSNEYRFIVDAAWRPNVYVTATVVRPVTVAEDWRPHRASGAVRLAVDCGDRKLALALDTPADTRPGLPLAVAVRVTDAGNSPVSGAAVTLAAVDEGVLALTGFLPQNPFDLFYAFRRLDIREMDMFDRLAPELSAWRAGKTPVPGGDGPDASGGSPDMARLLNPIEAKRVRTAVLYAGTLVTDADGVARAEVTLPEYLGELRWMVWAAEGDRFGQESRPMAVRSPVMFRASWPRFLAPGDAFEVPLTLFNGTEQDGAVAVKLTLDGGLEQDGTAPEPVAIAAGGEATIRLRLKAVAVGTSTGRIEVRLGEDAYGETIECGVRPASAFDRTSGSLTVPPGGTETIRPGGDFLPGTGRGTLHVSGHPTARVAGSIQMLLEYPYGCLEQTVSRMLPLLYAPDLAAQLQPGSVSVEETGHLLDAGFQRLAMMQTADGGLAMWPNNREPYQWGSLFACEMLLEARAAGYDVPTNLIDPLVAYVERHLPRWLAKRDSKGHPSETDLAAYACLVLTRAGARPTSAMATIEERILAADGGKKPCPLPASVRCHLALAFLAAGEHAAARPFLHAALPENSERAFDGALASPDRDTALLLCALLDAEPESPRIADYVRQLSVQLDHPWSATTQENAFTLMALGKYARRMPVDRDGIVRVTLGDGTTVTFPAWQGRAFADIAPGMSITIEADSTSGVHAFWRMEGVSRDGHVREEDSGLIIRRMLETADGQVCDPEALRQGALYRMIVRVTAPRQVANGVIVALLPAGLEIENQDLRSAAIVAGEGALSNLPRLAPIHVEPRDDRLLIFADFPAGTAEYRCLVRAVTAGTFALPAVEASSMYDPQCLSVHGRGTLTVLAAEAPTSPERKEAAE